VSLGVSFDMGRFYFSRGFQTNPDGYTAQEALIDTLNPEDYTFQVALFKKLAPCHGAEGVLRLPDDSKSWKVPPEYRGPLTLLVHLLVFGVLIDHLLVRGCKSPSVDSSTSPSLNEALPLITHPEPHFRLVSSHWYLNHSFEVVEGHVENLSNTPVDKVIAVASFFDSRGVHLADHAARLHYSSREQRSTFSVTAPHDPRMHTVQLTFRLLAGGAVTTDPSPGLVVLRLP
jgi:hypothetical protein